MAEVRTSLRELYAKKIRAEISDLGRRGVKVAGNACSEVLLLAQDFSDATKSALKAALDRLGYLPQDWELLWCPSDPVLLRHSVSTLDPASVIVCDEVSCEFVREAYADELSALGRLDDALFSPGGVVLMLGIRFLSLGDFAAALDDAHDKQIMWARLKKVPPLKEPY